MPIDYAATYTALFNRAASDSAGSSVRALLGSFPATFTPDTAYNGAKAVFPYDLLGRLPGVTLPWLVWRAGRVGGASGTMRDVAASWWAYAPPNRGEYVLHQIAAALDALYGALAPFALADGRIGVTFVGQPRLDTALTLNGIEVRIGYRRLG